MGETIKAYLRFWLECARRSVSIAWGSANNVAGALVGLVCGGVAGAYSPWLANHQVVATVLYTLIAWAVLLVLWALFIAPFKIYHEQQEQIRDLGKVDASDLAHMLGGFFFGNTFLLRHEGYLCKQFKGEAAIRHLHERPASISVRAPKHSVAGIYFQFTNGHPKPGHECRFYYVGDGGKDVLIENIHSEQKIMLNAKSCFELKLFIDPGYELHERAELWVTLRSWRK